MDWKCTAFLLETKCISDQILRWFECLTFNMSLLTHFCAKVQPKMYVDAYCTGNTDIQTQTVIHWPTELQKTKELQTNLITDAISPHCLSPFLLHRHKSTHILKHWDTAITAVIWCTEMYISHPQTMQDNISLKRQISLQIKISSSMSGHIQRHKSRQLQDTNTSG